MSVNQSSSPSAPQPPRNRFVLWMLLAFLVLLIACLAITVLAISGGRLPDLGRADVTWTPSPEQPTAAIEAPISPAPAGADGRFQPGDMVLNVNAGPVNLRQSPGFQNKPDSDIIMAVPARLEGEIVGGPEAADGLIWWQVRFGQRAGWMAERSSSGVTLLDRAP